MPQPPPLPQPPMSMPPIRKPRRGKPGAARPSKGDPMDGSREITMPRDLDPFPRTARAGGGPVRAAPDFRPAPDQTGRRKSHLSILTGADGSTTFRGAPKNSISTDYERRIHEARRTRSPVSGS